MTKSNARFRSVINLHFINHLSMYIYLKSMRLWGQDTLFSPFTECSEYRLSLVAQTINNLSVNARDLSSILGWEDSLEKKMATHSSILARKIPWTQESGRLQSTVSQRIRHDWATNSTTIKSSLHSFNPPFHTLPFPLRFLILQTSRSHLSAQLCGFESIWWCSSIPCPLPPWYTTSTPYP